jgi:FKBP-type peptidyl-prolyl cis-trans isomerase 2
MAFVAGLPDGQKIRLLITKVTDEFVSSRMVHPLAGQRIKMRVEILSVRAATAEESARGVVAG